MSMRSSPLLGYNNNVRHKGKIFHIQTEDSGAKYGHIMTHLFTDGGRIVKSVKTSYAEYIGNERMADIVREMMKEQHKAMFIALRDGKFDPTLGPLETPSGLRPNTADPPAAQAAPGGEVKRPAGVPPPLPPSAHSDRPAAAAAAAAASDTEPVLTLQEPEELTLDIEGLERAADAASPVVRTPDDLPPAPAHLLREKAATPPAPASSGGTPLPVRRPGPASVSVPNDRRYAPARPASIFGQARPQQGKTIFGEDPVSDKSLDEVILSYLADDLDGEKK
jgi:hypothetical protein